MKRTLSWLIALLAYFGPPVWVFFAFQADRKAQLAGHCWVTGLPIFGIVFLACISSGVLSLLATGLGIASFRALPRPRSWIRFVELGFLILPFLLGISLVFLLFCG